MSLLNNAQSNTFLVHHRGDPPSVLRVFSRRDARLKMLCITTSTLQ
jgi:hypothetical protein